MVVETPYRREPGYAERYRDRRFANHSGPRTHRREVDAIRRLLREADAIDGLWIDVPCGAGRLSALLPGRVVRADRDPAMLAACKGATGRVCATAAALPFFNRSFDGALCMRLMQHIPTSAERIAILGELQRVVRRYVVVSYFDALSLQHARRLVARRFGKTRSGRLAITGARFRADLEAAGLRVVSEIATRRYVSEQRVVLAQPTR